MKDEIREILLKHLLQQTLTLEEQEKLDNWKDKNSINSQVYSKLEKYWVSKNLNYDKSRVKVWDNIAGEVGHTPTKLNQDYIITYYKVAAVIILLLAATSLFYFNSTNLNEQSVVIEKISYTERLNEKGEQRTFRLSDGTVVKLNSVSKFKFPHKFSGDTREVFLEGEAYFDVAEDKTKPFIVHTGSVSTEVKGTSFNVKTISDFEDVVVSVVSGKVAVSMNSTDQQILLLPTEKAVAKTKEEVLLKQKFHSDEISWIEGKIIFKNTNIDKVFKDLEKWYGVNFILKKKIKLKSGFTGTYKRMALSDVLESIGYTAKFKYRIKGKEITIY